jgi:LysM repeat protein
MDELQDNVAPRPGNRRKGPSQLFLVSLGTFVVVIAVGLAITLVLLASTRQDLVPLQRTIVELQRERDQGNPLDTPTTGTTLKGPNAGEIREWISTLRSENAEARTKMAQAVADSRAAANLEHDALIIKIARILDAHGASPEEIAALTKSLSPAERRDLLTSLAIATAERGDQDDEPGGSPSSTGTDTPPVRPQDSGDSSSGTPEPTPEPEPTPKPEPTPDPTPEPIPPDVDPAPTPPDTEPTDPSTPESTGTSGTSPEEPTGSGDSSGSSEEVIIHTVRRGDTISGLAVKYKASEQAILKANKISNPRAIQIGQKLVIPKE